MGSTSVCLGSGAVSYYLGNEIVFVVDIEPDEDPLRRIELGMIWTN